VTEVEMVRAEVENGRVVERRADEVNPRVVRRDAEELEEHRVALGNDLRLGVGEGAADALGLAGRPRGVRHRRAGATAGGRGGRLALLELRVVAEAFAVERREAGFGREVEGVGRLLAVASQSWRMYATSGAVRWLLMGVMYQPACVAAR
jgi:hypothetical protein